MRISDWSLDVCSSDLADPGRACRDLAEAIRVMVAGPEIENALAEATRRMSETFDEESFAQQQRLRELKAEHDQRLADLMQPDDVMRSEEHTSELQSLMRISYAVFCLKKKNTMKK